MSIITLISDFGLKDHYVGILKAKIYSEIKDINLIDISHDIEKFNTIEAGYLLQASYAHFPKGTIHLILVDVANTLDFKQVFFELNGHFFIGNHNGMFNYLFKENLPEKVFQVPQENVLNNEISDVDKLINTVKNIVAQLPFNSFAEQVAIENKQYLLEPIVDVPNKKIRGYVIFIDDFENCITNITKQMLTNSFGDVAFSITIRKRKILKIIKNFNDFKHLNSSKTRSIEGIDVAYFNEAGFLEIAVYKGIPNVTGGAKALLGLNTKDVVELEII